MKIEIPQNVNKIIEMIQSAGFEAYAVGGCIRDSIMGLVPHDWDICTSALPEETLAVLGKTNIVTNGLKHGTVTVKFVDGLYEITTFRIDGIYRDNRRPESVTFVGSLREDLARRDFTVNAMAYNYDRGLCDYFGGENDIKNKIIRCVGDPDKRFREDGLRILRALRFSARLGFEIEKKTSDAIHKNADLLKNISAERIASELLGIIDGDYTEKVLTGYADVICIFIPEIEKMIGFEQHNPHHIYDIWTHTVKVIANSPHGKISRLAALFHDIAKPECYSLDKTGTGHFHGHPERGTEKAREIMKRLKLDNKTIDKVCMLIKYHDVRPEVNAKNVRRLISKVGVDNFNELMQLKRADAMGQNPDLLDEKLEYIKNLEELFYKQTADGQEYNLKTLRVKGIDLINIGITDGKTIGRILKHLLEGVINGELNNSHNELMHEVRVYTDNGKNN